MSEPGVPQQWVLMDVEPVAAGPVQAKVPVDKTFRRYDQDQPMLVAPDLRDWLGAGHPARWVDDLVEHGLDLSGVYAGYTDVRGGPPYDPRLMLKVLIYGYSHGITSSRALERRCHDDIAFRFLTAQAAPDFVAISRFRARHGAALKELFTQSLTLCAQAGLVSLGRVALDGTKVRANASRHRAMSYDRMVRAESETSDGSFHYCFNGQAVVDEKSQVVLAAQLRQSGSDAPALPDMLTELAASLTVAGINGRARTLLADAGYFSADNIDAAEAAGIDPLLATGRLKHGQTPPPVPRGRIPAGLTPKQRMSRKLHTKAGKRDYARCKAIVEPVFGQIKVAQGAHQLRLRGKVKAETEWTFHLACHNFRKLAGSGWTTTQMATS